MTQSTAVRSTAENRVKPRYAVPKSLCAVPNRRSGSWFDGIPRYGSYILRFFPRFRIRKFIDRLPAMHPVYIYDHPPSMNARARITQSTKNVAYINEWLFVHFTIQVIININKIIYFSAQILRDGNLTERYGVRFRWSGTARSTVWAWRYGTECGSGFFARYGSGSIFSVPCHSLGSRALEVYIHV